MRLDDSLGRPLRDLRISVTDRCNFRCDYCMPREHFDSEYEFLPKEKIISYEEIILIIKSALPLGLKKIRITGGEPLIRKDISKLIKMIRQLDEHIDIAMTTNGVLLRKNIQLLKKSGLNRVTVSLDSVDNDLFREITDSNFEVKDVLDGIEAAIEAGIEVKINTVIKRNLNEGQLIPLIEKSIDYNVPIRFIEFMDVGSTNSWNLDSVVTGSEMRKIIQQKFGPLVQKKSNYFGEVAKQWTILDKEYDFGFIESISSPFCGSCTRARISSNGHLFTCLFSEKGNDILSMIRMDAEVSDISGAIQKIWNSRNDKYSEERKDNTDERVPVEMSYIGG
ncbi:MAG: GTP 3',8-cyclase MoaA [Candidatus Poseidoniaceae archaeon]|nr:GTP 3',8-cyclase MoaA [Candidatus Poseidoniaceae archaeon]